MVNILADQTTTPATQGGVLSLDDLEWFQDIKNPDEKQYVRDHLQIFHCLSTAKSIKAESLRLARIYQSRGRGYSAKSMRDKFRDFRKAGCNPRSVVRKYANGKQGLPTEFIQFWQMLAGQNKRDDGTKAARLRLIHEIWAKGEHVPGFGTWQQWFLKTYPNKPLPRYCLTDDVDLPEGWSYETLNRHLPKTSTLKLMRKGFKAAHDHQKHLKRDRSNLLPLQLIAIDDFWLDQMVYTTTLGATKPCRAVGILAIDVATGIDLGFFIKPRTVDEFGKKEGIRQNEVKDLIRYILQGFGLPPYPITFLVENASASISQETEELLYANFGERIRIERTGVYNDLMLANGFAEKGGKPWEKTWVESFFRMLHTTAGHLPGQVGNRYDNAPGNIAAIEKYSAKVLSHPQLNEDDLKKLRLPIMRIEDAQRIYRGILDLLQNRHDHKLQGFDSVTVWRREPGDSWEPESTMLHADRIELENCEINTRLESPAERFRRLFPADKMSQVPAASIWPLYAKSKERVINNGKVTLFDKRSGHEQLEYWQENSPLLHENEGRKVTVYYEPEDPRYVLVTTSGPIEKREFLGVLPRDNAVDLLDKEALGKASGAIHRDRKQELEYVREITAQEDERTRLDKEFNEFIIARATSRNRGELSTSKRSAAKKIGDGSELLNEQAEIEESEHEVFDPSELL